MDVKSKKYIIDKIRNLSDGSIHERETRRKGHEVRLLVLQAGACMLWEYIEGGMVRTSIVQKFKYDNGVLSVITENSSYEFKGVLE